jgi:glycine cleavage system H protein
MNQVRDGLLYTEDHEWIRVEGDVCTVGITDYAQRALGDITFVDLPDVGKVVERGEEACAVESCKAAAGVFAPVSGTVSEVNAALADDPGRVNADCYGEGWVCKLTLSDRGELSRLKSPEQYRQMLASEA